MANPASAKARKKMNRFTGNRPFPWRVFDILALLLAIFLFLFINPSATGRPRLIYIALQTGIIGACLFLLRYVFGVYRAYFFGLNGKMYTRIYLHLIEADLLAGAVIYDIQLLIPEGPVRITFVKIVCILGLNLLVSVTARLLYQSGYDFEEK